MGITKEKSGHQMEKVVHWMDGEGGAALKRVESVEEISKVGKCVCVWGGGGMRGCGVGTQG